MSEEKYLAVITGANRGIGYEVARQLAQRGLIVIVTARDESQGAQAARQLTEATGGRVRSHILDVTNAQSVDRFARWVAGECGRVDVLVNNASVYPDEGVSGLAVDPETVRATFETNALGALRLCQHFLPGMCERRYGRVVNVSSGYGQMQRMGAVILGSVGPMVTAPAASPVQRASAGPCAQRRAGCDCVDVEPRDTAAGYAR